MEVKISIYLNRRAFVTYTVKANKCVVTWFSILTILALIVILSRSLQFFECKVPGLPSDWSILKQNKTKQYQKSQ